MILIMFQTAVVKYFPEFALYGGVIFSTIGFVMISLDSTIGFIYFVTGMLTICCYGAILKPTEQSASKNIATIRAIIAISTQVAISDISDATGLDNEYIRKVISDLLETRVLCGTLEDDLFIRDTTH